MTCLENQMGTMKSLVPLLAFVSAISAFGLPFHDSLPLLSPRQSSNCENTATSRGCWGSFSIDTNYYDVTPDTGVTREYWLSVENTTCAPDGYRRTCLTFNGTSPGLAIIADWGDTLVVHVTNNLQENGTTIHWHGVRQLGSVEYDGVPGVTQCPITPADTLTYRFRITQYGSTWYHSHLSLQYAEGLLGPLILNGPATADYDEDLGAVFLQDWGHQTAFSLWDNAKKGLPPTLDNGLVNGTNTFDCTGSTDPNCVGGGQKLEVAFESGKKYRMRLVNVATDGHFQFSIDGHNLTVIATDLVPIVPYTADSVLVSIGQRYDVIVEANAASGNYWLRAGWVGACSANANPANITAIVRYDNSSTADPTTSSTVSTPATCGDEPLSSLVPHLSLDVTNADIIETEDLNFVIDNYFKWTINSSSLLLNWSDPTLLQIFNNESVFPTDYNVVGVNVSLSGVSVVRGTRANASTEDNLRGRVGRPSHPRSDRNRVSTPRRSHGSLLRLMARQSLPSHPPPWARLLDSSPNNRDFRRDDVLLRRHEPTSPRRCHAARQRLPSHRVQAGQSGCLARPLPYCMARIGGAFA